MSNGQGTSGGRSPGLGGAAPGCCSRQIGGKPGGRGLAKPAPRPAAPKPNSTRPGFGAGRGFGRGGGIKR